MDEVDETGARNTRYFPDVIDVARVAGRPTLSASRPNGK